VKAGYLADLLLIDGNPLEDLSLLLDRDRIVMIMKDGAYHKALPADWSDKGKVAASA